MAPTLSLRRHARPERAPQPTHRANAGDQARQLSDRPITQPDVWRQIRRRAAPIAEGGLLNWVLEIDLEARM
jgi:hypothetical protein